ncbi:MAG: ComEC/Rec2 family competence protein [Gaiellales bacterium]
MSRCDRLADPTRVVLAALVGLCAAGLATPAPLPLVVVLGRDWRLRVVVVAVALAALVWGDMRVARLDEQRLHVGRFRGEVTVTASPSGDRAIASALGEGVLLKARGTRLVLGGRYLVDGRLADLDPEVRGYYRTQGVHLELDATGAVHIGRRGGVWGAVDSTHAWALRSLEVGPDPTPRRALVAGIVVGESGALPLADRDRLRQSGLYHIVAVSGQNVALIILFLLVALGLAGVIGTPARVAAIAATGVYVLMTGAGPSIVRAGVSGMLVAAAWLVSRPVRRWHLLALGAVAVLAVDPLELADPGFQLSFAAVAAIYLVAPRLYPALGQAVGVSVACTVATAPIVWWHFGRLSPLAVPANLLALPAVAPVLWLGVVAALLHSVWPPLAAPPLEVADLLAGYLLWVAELCS